LSFGRWIGIEGEIYKIRNFISIFALGWSYILSVGLFEMQGQNDAEIVYTQSIATGYNYDTGDRKATAITVEISDMDMDAAPVVGCSYGFRPMLEGGRFPARQWGVPVALVRIC
jgi:hypothetical protein